eukprot:9490286-Pyramimonas_sp.AAC.1
MAVDSVLSGAQPVNLASRRASTPHPPPCSPPRTGGARYDNGRTGHLTYPSPIQSGGSWTPRSLPYHPPSSSSTQSSSSWGFVMRPTATTAPCTDPNTCVAMGSPSPHPCRLAHWVTPLSHWRCVS